MTTVRSKSALIQRHLALIAALILLSFFSASAAFADAAGRITKTSGRADILKTGAAQAVDLAVDMQVSIGDIIRTKSDGSAEVLFVDGSAMTIGPKSRLGIDEYLFKPEADKRTASVKLYRGKMGFDVKKADYAAEGSKFEMKTRTAVAGIRGTKGILYTDGVERVYVMEGLINFASRLGAINVAAGFVGEILQGKPPVQRQFSPSELSRLESGLKPKLEMKDKDKKDKEDKGGKKPDKLSSDIISTTDAAVGTAENTLEGTKDTLTNLGKFVNDNQLNEDAASKDNTLPVTDVAKTTDSGVKMNFPSTPVNVNVTFP